jgi:hypothetical protein
LTPLGTRALQPRNAGVLKPRVAPQLLARADELIDRVLLHCMSPELADIVAKVPNCPAPIFLL